MKRATLRLSLACNNRCVFCAQDGVSGVDTRSLETLRAEADEITFVGGEPMLDPRLDESVARARALGFRRVGVQTNGHGFHVVAGLTDVHVSIHGAEPAVHDYHTGSPGSARELWGAVAAARAAGLTVVATTVLTRSNFRVIGALPALLRSRGVAGWLVVVPRVAGRAAAAFDRVVPRLGLALPFALHAVDAAGKTGLPAWIQGAPLCALGPLAAYALADAPRTYGAACEGCAARAACPGVDAAYLERFGGDELAAVDAVAIAGEDEITRMFVGVGELARALAAKPQRSLPIAGRPQPGRQEVSASAPRRSGEALREIFPELFED